MGSLRINGSLSRGLPNGRKPATSTKRDGPTTSEINFDRLIGIVRLRIEAQGDDELIRRNARDVLRRWKKRRGWMELQD